MGYVQRDRKTVAAFWDSTGPWRVAYFDTLMATDPAELSCALQCEREFAIVEKEIVDRLVASSGRIIELGCGVGRSLLSALRGSADVTRELLIVGVDIAREQLQLFGDSVSNEALDWVSIGRLLSDVGQLPLKRSAFDLVLICNQTLGNFLGCTRAATVGEARRVLRPGGLIFVGGFSNVALARLCYTAWGVPIRSIDYETGFIELRHYNTLWASEAEVIALFTDGGFELVQTEHVTLGYLHLFRRL